MSIDSKLPVPSATEITPLSESFEFERVLKSNGAKFELFEWGHYVSMNFEGEYTLVNDDQGIVLIVNNGQNALLLPKGITFDVNQNITQLSAEPLRYSVSIVNQIQTRWSDESDDATLTIDMAKDTIRLIDLNEMTANGSPVPAALDLEMMGLEGTYSSAVYQGDDFDKSEKAKNNLRNYEHVNKYRSVEARYITELANDFSGRLETLRTSLEKASSAERAASIRAFMTHSIDRLVGVLTQRFDLDSGLTLSEENRDLLISMVDKWAERVNPLVSGMVVELMRLEGNEGMKEVRTGVWGGPPGSGKGTVQEALARVADGIDEAMTNYPEPIKRVLLRNRTSKKKLIITGTNGMLNKPVGEYVDLGYDRLGKLTGSIAASGRLVGDAFTSTFTKLMLAMRIAEARAEGQEELYIQIDTWPRSTGQYADFTDLMSQVKEKTSVKTPEEMLYLGLDTAEVTVAMTEDRAGYTEASKNTSALINGLKKEDDRKADIKKYTANDANFLEAGSYARQLVQALREKVEATTKEHNLIDAIDRGLDRIIGRYEEALNAGKTPRVDENPVKYVLSRMLDAYGLTLPALLSAEDFEAVSGLASPGKVSEDVFMVQVLKAYKEAGMEPPKYGDRQVGLLLRRISAEADAVVAERQKPKES